MLYITQTQLMRESEQTVLERASSTDEIPRRICAQLLRDPARYSHWHIRHESHMSGVANARRHERQVLKLRSVAVDQVHRTALVRYLSDNHVIGDERDRTLRAFYGLNDPRDSALAEHRQFLLAASTQLCANRILELVSDRRGLELVGSYEVIYGQYFGMFCDRARALQSGRPYLLAALIPEVRESADRMRLRILDSALLPVRPISLLGTQAIRTSRTERHPPDASGASKIRPHGTRTASLVGANAPLLRERRSSPRILR